MNKLKSLIAATLILCLTSIGMSGSAKVLDSKTYSSYGTYTYNIPDNAEGVQVTLKGGEGGDGGGSNSQYSFGDGGLGGSGTVEYNFTNTSKDLSIGVGAPGGKGTGSADQGGGGGGGGSTAFKYGSTLIACGTGGGGGGGSSTTNSEGGDGGQGGGGDGGLGGSGDSNTFISGSAGPGSYSGCSNGGSGGDGGAYSIEDRGYPGSDGSLSTETNGVQILSTGTNSGEGSATVKAVTYDSPPNGTSDSPKNNVEVGPNVSFEFTPTCEGGCENATIYSNLTAPGVWDADWKYQKEISLTNSASNELTGFPASIEADTESLISQGKMNQDCSDLRIIHNSDKAADYEIHGCNTSTTKIYFKANISATGASDYAMYYGNSNATDQSVEKISTRIVNGKGEFGNFSYWCTHAGSSSGNNDGFWQGTACDGTANAMGGDDYSGHPGISRAGSGDWDVSPVSGKPVLGWGEDRDSLDGSDSGTTGYQGFLAYKGYTGADNGPLGVEAPGGVYANSWFHIHTMSDDASGSGPTYYFGTNSEASYTEDAGYGWMQGNGNKGVNGDSLIKETYKSDGSGQFQNSESDQINPSNGTYIYPWVETWVRGGGDDAVTQIDDFYWSDSNGNDITVNTSLGVEQNVKEFGKIKESKNITSGVKNTITRNLSRAKTYKDSTSNESNSQPSITELDTNYSKWQINQGINISVDAFSQGRTISSVKANIYKKDKKVVTDETLSLQNGLYRSNNIYDLPEEGNYKIVINATDDQGSSSQLNRSFTVVKAKLPNTVKWYAKIQDKNGFTGTTNQVEAKALKESPIIFYNVTPTNNKAVGTPQVDFKFTPDCGNSGCSKASLRLNTSLTTDNSQRISSSSDNSTETFSQVYFNDFDNSATNWTLNKPGNCDNSQGLDTSNSKYQFCSEGGDSYGEYTNEISPTSVVSADFGGWNDGNGYFFIQILDSNKNALFKHLITGNHAQGNIWNVSIDEGTATITKNGNVKGTKDVGSINGYYVRYGAHATSNTYWANPITGELYNVTIREGSPPPEIESIDANESKWEKNKQVNVTSTITSYNTIQSAKADVYRDSTKIASDISLTNTGGDKYEKTGLFTPNEFTNYTISIRAETSGQYYEKNITAQINSKIGGVKTINNVQSLQENIISYDFSNKSLPQDFIWAVNVTTKGTNKNSTTKRKVTVKDTTNFYGENISQGINVEDSTDDNIQTTNNESQEGQVKNNAGTQTTTSEGNTQGGDISSKGQISIVIEEKLKQISNIDYSINNLILYGEQRQEKINLKENIEDKIDSREYKTQKQVNKQRANEEAKLNEDKQQKQNIVDIIATSINFRQFEQNKINTKQKNREDIDLQEDNTQKSDNKGTISENTDIRETTSQNSNIANSIVRTITFRQLELEKINVLQNNKVQLNSEEKNPAKINGTSKTLEEVKTKENQRQDTKIVDLIKSTVTFGQYEQNNINIRQNKEEDILVKSTNKQNSNILNTVVRRLNFRQFEQNKINPEQNTKENIDIKRDKSQDTSFVDSLVNTITFKQTQKQEVGASGDKKTKEFKIIHNSTSDFDDGNFTNTETSGDKVVVSSPATSGTYNNSFSFRIGSELKWENYTIKPAITNVSYTNTKFDISNANSYDTYNSLHYFPTTNKFYISDNNYLNDQGLDEFNTTFNLESQYTFSDQRINGITHRNNNLYTMDRYFGRVYNHGSTPSSRSSVAKLENTVGRDCGTGLTWHEGYYYIAEKCNSEAYQFDSSWSYTGNKYSLPYDPEFDEGYITSHKGSIWTAKEDIVYKMHSNFSVKEKYNISNTTSKAQSIDFYNEYAYVRSGQSPKNVYKLSTNKIGIEFRTEDEESYGEFPNGEKSDKLEYEVSLSEYQELKEVSVEFDGNKTIVGLSPLFKQGQSQITIGEGNQTETVVVKENKNQKEGTRTKQDNNLIVSDDQSQLISIKDRLTNMLFGEEEIRQKNKINSTAIENTDIQQENKQKSIISNIGNDKRWKKQLGVESNPVASSSIGQTFTAVQTQMQNLIGKNKEVDSLSPIVNQVRVNVSDLGNNSHETTLIMNITDPDGNKNRDTVTFAGYEKTITHSNDTVELDIGEILEYDGQIIVEDKSGLVSKDSLGFDIEDSAYKQENNQVDLSKQTFNKNDTIVNTGNNPFNYTIEIAEFNSTNSSNQVLNTGTAPQGEEKYSTGQITGDFLIEDTNKWVQDEELISTIRKQQIRRRLSIENLHGHEVNNVVTPDVQASTGFSNCDGCSRQNTISFTGDYNNSDYYTDSGDIIQNTFEQDITDVNIGERETFFEQYSYKQQEDKINFTQIHAIEKIDDSEYKSGGFIDVAKNTTSDPPEFGKSKIGPTQTSTCDTDDPDLTSLTLYNSTYQACMEDRNGNSKPEYFRLVIPDFKQTEELVRYGGYLNTSQTEAQAPFPGLNEECEEGSEYGNLVCKRNEWRPSRKTSISFKAVDDAYQEIGSGIGLMTLLFILIGYTAYKSSGNVFTRTEEYIGEKREEVKQWTN